MLVNRKNKKIRFFIISINVVLLVLIILLTPLSFYTFNVNYYERLFEKNGVFDILDKSDVLDISKKITYFFKYGFNLEMEYPDITVGFAGEDENMELSFTANEVSHLYDVRNLLSWIFVTYYASILLFIILTLLLVRRNIASILYNTGLIFIASSTLSMAFIAFLYLAGRNFPVLFENFHVVFFPQGNYSFASGSLLITLFPSGFFYDFFVGIITCSVIMAVTLLLVGLFFIFVLKFTRKYNWEMI